MTKVIKIGMLTLDMGSVSDAIYVNTKKADQFNTALQFATYQAVFEKMKAK